MLDTLYARRPHEDVDIIEPENEAEIVKIKEISGQQWKE